MNALLGGDDASPLETGEAAENTAASTTRRANASRKEEPAKVQGSDGNYSTIVKISRIEPNPEQPRQHFDAEELEELSQSIKQNGLLQPILVREVNDRYQIIAGERRYQACKKIDLKEVPVRVTEADDIKSITLAMVENIQRADLNPMEEAYGYRLLMERDNLTQAQLAEAVSKGRSTIANSLRLLDLPEEAQQLLFEGKITAGHARAILSIPTDEGRQMLTRKLLENPVSVREAENLARLYAGRKTETPTRVATPKSFKKVAKSLRTTLGTNVRVKTVGGKNKIEIEFQDEDHLQEIFAKMMGK